MQWEGMAAGPGLITIDPAATANVRTCRAVAGYRAYPDPVKYPEEARSLCWPRSRAAGRRPPSKASSSERQRSCATRPSATATSTGTTVTKP